MSFFQKPYLKTAIIMIYLLSIGRISLGQITYDTLQKRPTNVLVMNSGGGATNISIEYERLWVLSNYKTGFGKKKEFFISTGSGLGFTSEEDPVHKEYLTIPLHVSVNFGKGVSFLELGFGETFIFGHNGRKSFSYFIFGYRAEPRRKHKLLFRVNLNLPTNFFKVVGSQDPTFIPLGIGFGISF